MTYADVIWEHIEKGLDLVILSAENRAPIRSIQDKLGARLIDTGIAEQSMCGMAAGLALAGKRPVIHGLATFLTMRSFEFIRTDIGIPNLPVKIVGSITGVLSEANGPTHQALEDISLMRGIPNMKVFAPADEQDLVLGLPAILADNSPWYIRYINFPSVIAEHQPFEIGKCEQVIKGDEILVLTYGALFRECYGAVNKMREQGIHAGLVNVRTLKPLDKDILKLISKAKLTVTVEDHFLTGGLFSALSEMMVMNSVSAKVVPIAFDEKWFKSALLNDVLEYEKLNADSLVERILAIKKSV